MTSSDEGMDKLNEDLHVLLTTVPSANMLMLTLPERECSALMQSDTETTTASSSSTSSSSSSSSSSSFFFVLFFYEPTQNTVLSFPTPSSEFQFRRRRPRCTPDRGAGSCWATFSSGG
ncbi:hypothetical protein SprV_0702447500 [Sparganum proliferum]